jgi:RNA polymerase I-specific transcription initiation factor RRN6
MRLDVRSQIKYPLPFPLILSPQYVNLAHRNHDGTILAMFYKGNVKLTPGVGKILTGAPDAKTSDYGDSFVSFTFETGSEKYAELQNGTYVAAGHFVKEEGKEGTVVEYKVSKVVYRA